MLAPIFTFAQEQIIQGAFNNKGQTAVCALRYYGGKITAYAVDKTYMGEYNWRSMYPDSPHPTNSYQDGSWYRSYYYKVSVGNTEVYFNLPKSSGYGGNSYGGNTYGNQEQIVQGVFIYNGRQNLMMLRFYGGTVMNYATSKGFNGHNWQNVSRPDNARPTTYLDGDMQRSYNYKVDVDGITVYFNK